MAKATVPESQEFNPLNIDYGLRFDENEIPDVKLRSSLNSTVRKLRGISAIAKIIQANEVEKSAQDEPSSLTPVLIGGLYDALIELAEDGSGLAEEIGLRTIAMRKEAQS